ncbi:MAG: nucleotide exchange factor GrpE [Intestinimonas sp.]|jgi:molecular chaperone GrpE|nr:nucleotide exchange factor GrpE [Intestinimonas sp.]
MANDKNTENIDLEKESAAVENGTEEKGRPQDAPEEPAARPQAPGEESAQEKPSGGAPDPLLGELESLKNTLAAQEEKYLRLAAEYDNFRKRSQKEKDGIYNDARADVMAAFLPVYDNLERALKQQTCDDAYAKGVEMTMKGLTDIMAKLGIELIPAQDQPFDPTLHNAVMHIDDENLGEGIIADVFQQGFKLGDKVIRFAMVKVAN